MYVTYRDDSGAEQVWDFNPGRVRANEAELVEKRYGKTYDMFKADVQAGSMAARRVLLWHLLRKDHPTLRFEDTPDFYAEDLVVEHNVDELAAIRDALGKAAMSEADREMAMSMLDAQVADALAKGEQLSGKAKSKPAG